MMVIGARLSSPSTAVSSPMPPKRDEGISSGFPQGGQGGHPAERAEPEWKGKVQCASKADRMHQSLNPLESPTNSRLFQRAFTSKGSLPILDIKTQSFHHNIEDTEAGEQIVVGR